MNLLFRAILWQDDSCPPLWVTKMTRLSEVAQLVPSGVGVRVYAQAFQLPSPHCYPPDAALVYPYFFFIIFFSFFFSFILRAPFGKRRKWNLLGGFISTLTGWILDKIHLLVLPVSVVPCALGTAFVFPLGVLWLLLQGSHLMSSWRGRALPRAQTF